MIADLLDIAKNNIEGPVDDKTVIRALGNRIDIKNITSILSRYYLRFYVIDKPSVLARISKILGACQVSISDVIQRERSEGKVVPLILLTHESPEKDVRAAIRSINRLPFVKGASQVIRMEEAGA